MNIKPKNLQILYKLYSRNVRINKSYNFSYKVFSDIEFFFKAVVRRKFYSPAQIDVLVEQIKPDLLSFKISNSEKLTNEAEIKKFLFNTKPNNCYSYLVKPQVIENMVEIVKPYFSDSNCRIVEVNPGLGCLTCSLINSGISTTHTIHIMEKPGVTSALVNRLMKNFPVKSFIDENFFSRSPWELRKAYTALFTSVLETQVIHKLVGVVPRTVFFTNLTYEILNTHQISNVHFIEFYFIFSEYSYNRISVFRDGRLLFSTYCLLHLFFDVEILAEYSRDAVFPMHNSDEGEKLYFVKLKGKDNVFDVVDEEELIIYLRFLKILGRRRYMPIIPVLEEYFPDCGLLFISKGITPMTRTCDLNAEDSITLFNICKNLSNYSAFEQFCAQDDY